MKKHYYKKSSTKITLSTNVFVTYYLSCINKYIVYIKLVTVLTIYNSY